MRTPGIAALDAARLDLSPSPTAEVAAAALLAQSDAELERASFLVVAVAPGELDEVGAKIRAAVGLPPAS